MRHSYFDTVLLLCSLALFVSGVAHSQAADDVSCYRIEIESAADELDSESGSETWCYQDLVSPEGAVFVFNADSPEVRSELSFVTEPEGTLIHSSMLAGQLTVHRVWAHQYNPFSVPAREPLHLKKLSMSELKFSISMPSAKGALQILFERAPPAFDMAISDGRFSDSVSPSAKPWRGFWWPRKGQPLSNGSDSPLGKYDRYVKARTGTNPGARSWENTYHRYKGVSWEGHCNGWVASSVLRPQPENPKYDSLSGVTFSVSDQKGLLAAMDYCASVAFFGKRYRGRGDNPSDIFPAAFHKTLVYYIGQLGKPVAIDYRRKSSVDNHIISGYEMDIKSLGRNRYSVSTVVTIHKYDKSRSDTPGIAPTYTRTYSYYLTTDESGNPVSGSWRSTNPDFLWVPLSVQDCSKNNPQVVENWIQEIVF